MSTVKIWLDPITRIEGHLAAYIEIDTTTTPPHVTTAYTSAMMFRGFEVFLRGRPPEDAIAITSRSCGVCGAAHANASALANDVASGYTPTPLGVALRNMAYSMTDYIYDHPLILNMLGGPDYSELIVSKLTPSVWQEAQTTPTQYSGIHGYKTIADIMRDLNPITGRIWQLTVEYQRIAREAGVLLYGRHSHPSTLVPGGISTDLSLAGSIFEQYYTRLTSLTAWVKFVWAIWQDLHDFYVSLGYELNGKTHDPPSEFTGGWADDPETYGSFASTSSPSQWKTLWENLDEIYQARLEKPGYAQGSNLITKSVVEINQGWLEFVDTSFYHDWYKHNIKPPWGYWITEDPLGNPIAFGNTDLVPYHPWNKTTMPNPQAINFTEKYSWDAEPRLMLKDGTIAPIETNPISQLWIDTLYATKVELQPYGEIWSSNGSQLSFKLLPAQPSSGAPEICPTPGGCPDLYGELTITWNLPKYSTTIERVLARAVHLALVANIAWANLEYALTQWAAGHTRASSPWAHGSYPSWSYSIGWWHVPRGTNQHWLVQSSDKILNYQYQAPTTKNVSPRNNRCTGIYSSQCTGPFEMAALNSWVTEEVPPDQWTGLDIVRAIRSFDPCLACAVHAEVKGEGGRIYKTIEKVIYNACSL
jgi:hydrogenase large subunit